MVDVYQHGGYHDQIDQFPIAPKEQPGDNGWNEKM